MGYGALQRSRNLFVALCARHEVFLLSQYRDKDLALAPDIEAAHADLERYCAKAILCAYPSDPNHLAQYRIATQSLFSRTPYSVLLYQSKDFVGKALQVAREAKVDLIHADTLGLAEALLDAKSVAMVLNSHNIESDMMFRRAEKETNLLKKAFLFKEARALQTYEARYCPRYDLNIVVSDQDGERLEKIAPRARIATIENSVDVVYYTHYLRTDQSRGLLFNGSLDWYANADAMAWFLDAIWPRVCGDMPDVTLMVIGKNPPEALRAALCNQDRIRWEGFVADLRELVRAARVFVCPMRDGGGTRLKILDALAQGIPIVSTTLGCEGIPVVHEESILIADTSEAFAAQIKRLLHDAPLCDKLSRNGRRLVEARYATGVVGDRLSRLYESLI